MKRMMPMAVAGLFFATVAFANTGHKTPVVNQNTYAVTDTIPTQPEPDTLPPTTEPTQEDTASQKQVVPEPSVTDTSTTNPTMVPEKDTTDGWMK